MQHKYALVFFLCLIALGERHVVSGVVNAFTYYINTTLAKAVKP